MAPEKVPKLPLAEALPDLLKVLPTPIPALPSRECLHRRRGSLRPGTFEDGHLRLQIRDLFSRRQQQLVDDRECRVGFRCTTGFQKVPRLAFLAVLMEFW